MSATLASTGTFLAYASRTNSAIPVPAGVASGDVLVAYLYADDSTPTITPPTGFTELTFSPAPATSSPTMRVRVYWKRATGADTGSYTFTHAAATTQGVALRITGATPSGTPVEVLGSAARATAGSSTPAITGTTSGPNELLLFAAFEYASVTWTSISGWADAHNGDGQYNATKLQAAAGSTGAITVTASAPQAQVATLVGVLSSPGALALTGTGTLTFTGTPHTAGTLALGGSGTLTVGPPPETHAGQLDLTGVGLLAFTGTGTWPHLAITATPDPASSPPRIRIDIADTRATPATSLTVTRTNPDGHTYPVRTPDGGPLALSAGAATIWDYEPPYDSPITYSTDVAGGDTAVTELDIDDVWLVHPGVPSRSRLVTVTSLPPGVRATSSSQHKVLGAAFPVPISSGARQAPASTLGLRTYSDADAAAIDALCADDTVLLLNIPPSKAWGWPACYVSVGDLTPARTVAYGRVPTREWSLPIQVVGRPGGGTQGAIAWATIAAQYRSWQAIKDAGITSWAQLASPTT